MGVTIRGVGIVMGIDFRDLCGLLSQQPEVGELSGRYRSVRGGPENRDMWLL